MLLEKIRSPEDLRKLSLEQLPTVADEIRRCMIETVSSTGGHLASSLGAVELIIALHYCLDTPKDKIIFDVGHQSYAHKILTGRHRDFHTLRQYKGISGFPCRKESAYDTFTTGHSSTSVSLALGLVAANDYLKSDERFKVAAVVGDGSLSGGLCFEGLNNAGHLKKDILIILNTNELSIAPNVGALSTYLNKVLSLPLYNRFRDSLEGFVKSRIPKGGRIISLANKFEEGLKGVFIPGMLFEELGFRYFGPLDGHNIHVLTHTLKNLLELKGPRLLHVITKKGKGYPPAEKDPVRFHSAGPFEVSTGDSLSKAVAAKSYTEVFSNKLVALAKTNPKIVAITAAMPEGTGLDKFRDTYPGRFFDVGIAEAHAVCFASGLATAGLTPVVAIYSTFLQRAFDQIMEGIALQEVAAVFAIDRAGVVGEDGVTHQGVFDIPFLRTIPHMVIMAPKDAKEFEAMLEFAVGLKKPVAIRYPRSACPVTDLPCSNIALGKAEVLKEGKDFLLVALGSMVLPCLEAIKILESQGLRGTLVNARFAAPLDGPLLQTLCAKTELVFSAEEGVTDAGFGSAVSEALQRPLIRLGLPQEFISHGRREILLEHYGLTKERIAKKIMSVIGKRS